MSLPSLCWHCPPHCAGVVTLVALASLPLLHCCSCNGAVDVAALVSLLLLHRGCCCCCNGPVAAIALHCHPCLADIFALICLALDWRRTYSADNDEGRTPLLLTLLLHTLECAVVAMSTSTRDNEPPGGSHPQGHAVLC